MVQTSSDKPWKQITMEPKTMEPKTMETKNQWKPVAFWFHGFIFDGKLGSMVFWFHGLSELVPNHGFILVPWFYFWFHDLGKGNYVPLFFGSMVFWFHGLSELVPNHGTTVCLRCDSVIIGTTVSLR